MLAAFAALAIWGIAGNARAARLTREQSAADARALRQVTEYLGELEVTLRKASLTGSAGLLNSLSSELQTEALGAKTGLAALSAGEETLTNTNKFLSQVGNFTAALAKKAERGEALGNEDRQNLDVLQGCASALRTRYAYMAELLDAGYLKFEELKQSLWELDDSGESAVGFSSLSVEAEENMDALPTLIYDGPFSDHIFTKESALLNAAPELTETEAKALAARALGVGEAYLITEPEAGGRLARYRFSSADAVISVTKNGGYVLSVLSDRAAGEERLSQKQAEAKAEEYLESLGYRGMAPTYAFTEEGVRCFNFAATLGDWTLYPDLVKVGVSLTDGSLVSMDASDYLMNHTEREAPGNVVSLAEAAGALSPLLTVKSTGLALIPTAGGGETFAYEFLCATPENTDVLVYVDAVTGREADILLLVYADGGTLTK